MLIKLRTISLKIIIKLRTISLKIIYIIIISSSTYSQLCIPANLYEDDYNQAPVDQKMDSAIYRINLYPVDSAILLFSLILIHWIEIYPMDSAIQLLND